MRQQIILFESQAIAERVAAHLHRVETQGNCLNFSRFDARAFDLALGLEGLDRNDYCCSGQYSLVSDRSKDSILESYGRIIFLMNCQQVMASIESFNLALRRLNENVADALGLQRRK